MKRFILLLVTLFAMTNVMAQLQPDMPIPADKEVRVGRLENGMTYYIRHNEKPKGQASFYIFHHVGAVQEEDSQQGLAHFLEHMAFKGTQKRTARQIAEEAEATGQHLDEKPVTLAIHEVAEGKFDAHTIDTEIEED